MYASIRRYRTSPGAAEEIVRRANEELMPVLAGASGFVAYYALDTGEDEVASVSIFEDRAGAEDSNRKAAEWVERAIAPLVAGPPEVIAGEVRAQRVAPARS